MSQRPRSSRRISPAMMVFSLGLIVGAGGSYLWQEGSLPQLSVPATSPGGRAIPVVRIVDGDTVVLLIEGKEHKVRLIGVDTPETVKPNTPVQPYGKEASSFTRNLLKGESVYLEYDPSGAGKEDRYGRDLAFLYRAPDSFFVNLELVRQGYARVYRKVEFKYRSQFEAAEEKAQEDGKGLWGE